MVWEVDCFFIMMRLLISVAIFQKGRFLIKDVEVELENGNKATFQYWDKADTAMIVPVTDKGDVIFITEYQHALNSLMLSLPKGRIEKGEASMEVANKELQEEIGYKANKLVELATKIEEALNNPSTENVA